MHLSTRVAQIQHHKNSHEIAMSAKAQTTTSDSADCVASLHETLAPLRALVRRETRQRPETRAPDKTSLAARHISDDPESQPQPAIARLPDFFHFCPSPISPPEHQKRSLECRESCWATWQRFHPARCSPKLPSRLAAPLQLRQASRSRRMPRRAQNAT